MTRTARRLIAIALAAFALTSPGCGGPRGEGDVRQGGPGGGDRAGRQDGPHAPRAVTLLGLDVVDAHTAFAFGDLEDAAVDGVVLRTTDGGATWAAVLRVPGGTLVGVDFLDARQGTALADDGVIFSTADGGQRWTAAPGAGHFARRPASGRKAGAEGPELFAVFSPDGRTGWAGGIDSDAGPSGVEKPVIYRTTDGGVTWKPATVRGAEAAPVVAFASAGPAAGYAVAGTSTYDAQGALLKSADGGATWVAAATGIKQVLTGVAAPAPGRIVVVGITAANGEGPGQVFVSDDDGASWRAVLDAGVPLAAVRFADAQTGWAVGGDKVFRTGDGGLTWTEQGLSDLSAGQTVEPPQSDASVDAADPFFAGLVLVGPGRGFAASDEGVYEIRP